MSFQNILDVIKCFDDWWVYSLKPLFQSNLPAYVSGSVWYVRQNIAGPNISVELLTQRTQMIHHRHVPTAEIQLRSSLAPPIDRVFRHVSWCLNQTWSLCPHFKLVVTVSQQFLLSFSGVADVLRVWLVCNGCQVDSTWQPLQTNHISISVTSTITDCSVCSFPFLWRG